jgi:large subunit ribosomal protein L2
MVGSYLKTIVNSIKMYRELLLGYRVLLSSLKKNFIVFDVNLTTKKPMLACSNGTYCQILDIYDDLNIVLLLLPSGEKKYVSKNSLVTLGRNSNIYYKYIIYGSAGSIFERGRKSIVRGVAMNPVDHPHGGRTKTNKPEVSP